MVPCIEITGRDSRREDAPLATASSFYGCKNRSVVPFGRILSPHLHLIAQTDDGKKGSRDRRLKAASKQAEQYNSVSQQLRRHFQIIQNSRVLYCRITIPLNRLSFHYL